MKGLMMTAILAARCGWGVEPNLGYYQGPATTYPYSPVYTAEENGRGQAYSVGDPRAQLPRSAPLPAGSPRCEWFDLDAAMRDPNGAVYYQWDPRIMPPERARFLGERVCYFEDRGEPMGINDRKRDAEP
jgi:hypothetical protein